MEKTIEKIIIEEAEKLNITPSLFYELVEAGCEVAFQDGLLNRVELFGGSNFFTEQTLREFIIGLSNGGFIFLSTKFD